MLEVQNVVESAVLSQACTIGPEYRNDLCALSDPSSSKAIREQFSFWYRATATEGSNTAQLEFEKNLAENALGRQRQPGMAESLTLQGDRPWLAKQTKDLRTNNCRDKDFQSDKCFPKSQI